MIIISIPLLSSYNDESIINFRMVLDSSVEGNMYLKSFYFPFGITVFMTDGFLSINVNMFMVLFTCPVTGRLK